MSQHKTSPEGGMRIVHILRSPVGGLFRHVLDLARAQIVQGHLVGLVADSSTGGVHAERVLEALRPSMALGLTRLPMRRDPHIMDGFALLRVARTLKRMAPDVVHGHGAKGALYARLFDLPSFSATGPIRVYTPHGGSLHHDPRSLAGGMVLAVERLLGRRTDMILFESAFAAERYRAAIGEPGCLVRVVHNGLSPGEFAAVTPAAEAADVLYLGEMRNLKGVDVLIDALAALNARMARPVTAVLVGSGPDRDQFEAQVAARGLQRQVTFREPMAARDAFGLAQVLVVPSRAESLPYVVLEAAAAEMPMVATRVGGIPEIFGGAAEGRLIAPGDPVALEHALATLLSQSPARRHADAVALGRFVETRFAVGRMADGVMSAYRDALAAKRGTVARPSRPALPSRPRYGL